MEDPPLNIVNKLANRGAAADIQKLEADILAKKQKAKEARAEHIIATYKLSLAR
jgi:hypothetical protein